MKRVAYKHLGAYRFSFRFVNGEEREADLQPLIGEYVAVDQAASVRLDPEWGCLEFADGRIDIAPATLYRFVH